MSVGSERNLHGDTTVCMRWRPLLIYVLAADAPRVCPRVSLASVTSLSSIADTPYRRKWRSRASIRLVQLPTTLKRAACCNLLTSHCTTHMHTRHALWTAPHANAGQQRVHVPRARDTARRYSRGCLAGGCCDTIDAAARGLLCRALLATLLSYVQCADPPQVPRRLAATAATAEPHE